ncbi:MAG: nodulation protein NfeD, partial [Chloroflexota bacterium]|nr:nodulation protein NfeD [Chloroflexota bacterium]
MGKASLMVLRLAYLASLILGILLLALGAILRPSAADAAPGMQQQQNNNGAHVDVAPFKLAITPISAQYYDRLISTAENDGANALVIELDTPGGLVASMEDMVQHTLASHVPIIVYVAPQFAVAGSAGLYIVYASHVAAMAPNTTIGSSEVVGIGDTGGTSGTPETGDAATERRKITNDLVSRIDNLADLRHRSRSFGEKAVTVSQNYGAQAALKEHVVD